MIDGITVHILGDYGPFSRMGKSVGYQITIGESSYLIDCGAPIFQQIGGHGLKEINGLIITHCHDDHKRWFTDLALFGMYAPDFLKKISLFTSEDVYNELMRASIPALDRSLSIDSKNVIDMPYEGYVNYQMLGPRAKYRIVSINEGCGKTGLRITDSNGDFLRPDRAKIIISEKTGMPRMLFKDPNYKEWIEPESFYPFSSNIFYEEGKNVYTDKEGFTIAAIKASVWHGIPGIGVKIKTNEETLVFSSDTVNDKRLWEALYTEKRDQRLTISKKEFLSSSVIYGDINHYIERIWSEERYKDAINAFNDAMVIHDVSVKNSIVHTDYEKLNRTLLKKDSTILTHGPDKLTSEWVLCKAEKTFKVKKNKFFERVGNKSYPMNADIYHKEGGRFYVGYKNKQGKYIVYEDAGLLRLSPEKEFDSSLYTLLYRIDLYEDISGRYFPKIENGNAMYMERKEGKIEFVEFTQEGSKGIVINDQRDGLCNY